MRSRLNFKIQKRLSRFFTILLVTIIMVGCKGSATGVNGSDKDSKTYDLVLTSDGSKVGEITTSRITEDDDAYIDDGFSVTLDITNFDFNAPFDITSTSNGGLCGTWDVQPGEKGEMPCDYDKYLANPEELKVTSENGDGIEAHPSP